MNSPLPTAAPSRIQAGEWYWAAGGALAWTLVLMLLPPTVFEGVDFSRFCDPVIQLFRTSVLRGEMPWWNPYSSLGRPFAVDMQTASFYPTTYLSVFLDTKIAWAIASTLHGMLAISGVIRLANLIGVARPAARVGGIIFLFSGQLITRMEAGQVPYVYALCYLPFVIYLAARLALTPTWRNWAALAFTWGLQLLCSHPQVSWLSALGAGAFSTGLLLQRPWKVALQSWIRTAFTLCAACASGMALLGFVVVPFLELASQSDRALPSPIFSASLPMVSLHWLSLITAQSALFPINWEYNLYLGIVTLIGGVAALMRWRDPAMRGIICLMLLGVIIAVGDTTPLFALLFKFLPGLSSFRIPSRAGVLVMLGVILGAAKLASSPSERRDSGAVIMIGVVLTAILILHYFQRMLPNEASLHWLIGRLVMVAVAVTGWCLWFKPIPDRTKHVAWTRLVLPAILLVELCLMLFSIKKIPTANAQFPAEDVVVSAIREYYGDQPIAPVRVALSSTLVRENSGMIHRYSTVTGFESLTLARVSNYLHQTTGATADSDALNVSIRLPINANTLAVNAHPDPRAYVATRITPVDDAPAAVARMINGHPFHRDALIERAWLKDLRVEPSLQSGSASITQFNLNSIQVSVDSPSAGILVVAEAWYPGWRASIANRQVDCVPVNGWMRGVPVPAGHSLVQLTFHQNGILPGTIISVAAALLLIWAALTRPAIPSKSLAVDSA